MSHSRRGQAVSREDPEARRHGASAAGPTLRRALGLWLLVLYGLGVIIGAGIYVVVGAVMAEAGMAAALSFALAGVLAALTGLCYAELGSRFPEAAGAAAYVKEAFGSDRLSQATGLAVAAVVVVSTATIARGSVGYAQAFVALPDPVIAGGVVALFTAVACLGVKESVGLAAAMTAIEIAGLLIVVAAGYPALADLPVRLPELLPQGAAGVAGVVSGAFLAFFAFIGFENLVNMGEETRDVERTMPRAILLSIALSALIYVVVALVASLAVPLEQAATASAPLLLVIGETGWVSTGQVAAIALIAIANGVLIEIVMLARLLFGMARRGWLPGWLFSVSRRTGSPVRATLAAGTVVLLLTVTLPLTSLVSLTSSMTLLVFALVDLSLWRVHRRQPRRLGAFAVPGWIPPLAAVASLAMVLAHLAD